MRRARSQAYCDFVGWVRTSKRPLKRAIDAHNEGDDIWQYLLCSVIVLTHSHFETYFKSVIHQVAAQINSRKLPAGKLPGLVWGAMLHQGFPHQELKRFYVFENEREYLESLSKKLTNAAALPLDWHKAAHVGVIDSKAIMGGDSAYPSFDRLKSVFLKVAKLDFRAEINRRIGSDPENVLQEISGLRGAMAHVGLPTGITPLDVEAKLNRFCRLVKAIDDMVVAEILGGALK